MSETEWCITINHAFVNIKLSYKSQMWQKFSEYNVVGNSNIDTTPYHWSFYLGLCCVYGAGL